MNKKIVSAAVSSIFAAGLAFGMPLPQDQPQASSDTQQAGPEHGRNGHMDPERQLAMLTRKLNLTSEQQNQIRPILTNRKQEMETLHADTSLSREDRMSKMKAYREESREKIEAVLNADQKPIFEQMQQQRSEGHGRKNGEGASDSK